MALAYTQKSSLMARFRSCHLYQRIGFWLGTLGLNLQIEKKVGKPEGGADD